MNKFKSLIALTLITASTLSKEVNAGINEYDKKEIVTALINVNVRKEPNSTSEKLGLLWGTESADLISIENDNWYKINYYGEIGYVSSEYVKISTTWDVETNPTQVAYLTQDISMPFWDANDVYSNEVIEKQNQVGYIIEYNNNKYTLLVNDSLLEDISSEYIQEIDLNKHTYPNEVEKTLTRIRHEAYKNTNN